MLRYIVVSNVACEKLLSWDVLGTWLLCGTIVSIEDRGCVLYEYLESASCEVGIIERISLIVYRIAYGAAGYICTALYTKTLLSNQKPDTYMLADAGLQRAYRLTR